MRIAFLSVSAEMGGSEVSLLELVRGLRRLAQRVEPVVVVPRAGPLAARIVDAGGAVRVLPMPAALASFGEWSMRGPSALVRGGGALLNAAGALGPYRRALSALLDDITPDVIHTNGFKLHVIGSRAARAGVPVVWHVHEYVSRRPLSRRLLQHHVSRASAVVANSRSVADDVRIVLGPETPISTIYNAVDLQEFAPEGDAVNLDTLAGLPAAAAGTVRVGLIATFARWKGHELFLRAIRRLGAESRVRAYVIGGPVYDTAGSQYTVDELRALAASLGVGDRVGFTGFIERPSTAMRALDVIVHASTEPEPFGLVIAEGLACGRAVIASAAGGAAELVEHDADALTFAPGDAGALADAVERCARDSALRVRLGAVARRTAIRRFNPDLFAGEFLKLYERAALQATAVTT
jgi:glycosyltransferase involved in cell wall biosynthesis